MISHPDQIDTILGLLLDHEFDLLEQPPVLPAQLEIRDERSFESRKLPGSLEVMLMLPLTRDEYTQIGQGLAQRTRETTYYLEIANLLKGRSAWVIWTISIYTQMRIVTMQCWMTKSREESLVQGRWTRASEKCLEQVNHYARCYNSRYCYLVSPIEVLLGRRRMDGALSPSRSLAKNRPIRPSTTASQPQRGDSAPYRRRQDTQIMVTQVQI